MDTSSGWPGRRPDSLRPSHGIGSALPAGARATRTRVGGSATGSPPRRNGRCSSRSCGAGSGAPWDTTTSSVAVPVGLCRRTAVLRPPTVALCSRALHHRPAVDLDQLVDQAGGRRAGAGDHRGADAVGVDRLGGERGDGVLVQVAGDHDPGLGRAERVEQRAGLPGQHRQVAGVDPDRPRSGPATSIAVRMPSAMSYVSTSSVVPCPAPRPGRRTRRPRRRAAG